MAMSIKTIPVLAGQCAVDFVSAADANSQKQTPRLTSQEAERIKDVMEKSIHLRLYDSNFSPHFQPYEDT